MIGNDVISISASSDSPKTRCERFIRKLFTINEQRLIRDTNSEDREQLIWLLWSMKESAYKSFFKQFKKRRFAPKMFDCYLNPPHKEAHCTAGNVRTIFQDYSTQSYILEDCIHTVAFINKRQVIHDYCFPLKSDRYGVQAGTVRRRMCKELAQLEGCPPGEIEIRKDAKGIPQVYIFNKKAEFDVSMSHHGTFGAYAISHELY